MTRMPAVSSWRRAAAWACGLLALAWATHAGAAGGAGEPPAPARWVVADVVDSAPVTGLDDAQAAALVGQAVAFGPDAISFERAACASPRVTRAHKPAARFFRDHRIAAPSAWRKAVDWWEVKCAGPETIGPFLVDGGDMLFVWYGVLLHARPAAPG